MLFFVWGAPLLPSAWQTLIHPSVFTSRATSSMKRFLAAPDSWSLLPIVLSFPCSSHKQSLSFLPQPMYFRAPVLGGCSLCFSLHQVNHQDTITPPVKISTKAPLKYTALYHRYHSPWALWISFQSLFFIHWRICHLFALFLSIISPHHVFVDSNRAGEASMTPAVEFLVCLHCHLFFTFYSVLTPLQWGFCSHTTMKLSLSVTGKPPGQQNQWFKLNPRLRISG